MDKEPVAMRNVPLKLHRSIKTSLLLTLLIDMTWVALVSFCDLAFLSLVFEFSGARRNSTPPSDSVKEESGGSIVVLILTLVLDRVLLSAEE